MNPLAARKCPVGPAEAAAAIREARRRRQETGERLAPDEVIHGDARPKYFWFYRWSPLPGLQLTIAGSTRSKAPPEKTYSHDLLPGWVYRPDELWELVDDLENLAAGKGLPTKPTRNPRKGEE